MPPQLNRDEYLSTRKEPRPGEEDSIGEPDDSQRISKSDLFSKDQNSYHTFSLNNMAQNDPHYMSFEAKQMLAMNQQLSQRKGLSL